DRRAAADTWLARSSGLGEHRALRNGGFRFRCRSRRAHDVGRAKLRQSIRNLRRGNSEISRQIRTSEMQCNGLSGIEIENDGARIAAESRTVVLHRAVCPFHQLAWGEPFLVE